MTPAVIRSFGGDDSGAVSPLFALSMVALIAIAGIGFDYGRLVAMNSELQNAADQAALAAATQLDGRDDAMIRARTAASNTFANASSAFVNETRFANDAEGRPITSLTFTFYDGYANDTPGQLIADDGLGAQAKVVKVTVNGRKLFYALTPVVDAITSGDITANAMAMLKRAVCKVPPIMVCIDRSDFPRPADEGKGLVMRSMPNDNAGPLAPGNFGFLNLYGEHSGPQTEMGQNKSYEGCAQAENVTTEPGFRARETTALNTRFDMYAPSLSCQAGSGDFCPAEGVRKNYVLAETKTITTNSATPPAPPPCGDYDSRSTSWTADPAVDNFRLDDCFYDGSCTYLGDGNWDINGFLATNHPGMSAADFAKGTRYEIYQWELADKANRLQPRLVSSSVSSKQIGHSGRYNHTFTNQCAYAQPVFGTPLPASSTQQDRRILTVATVNCSGLHGRDPVTIQGWMDVFLTEPSTKSGVDELGTIYAEVIGPAVPPNGQPSFQYYDRDRAVLIR